MEEHPELSARGCYQAGDEGNYRADHRYNPCIALCLRSGGVYSRHFRRAVSAVCGDGRGLDVPFSDQCSDLSPALCGVLLRPHHGPRRGMMGWIMRMIDHVEMPMERQLRG